MSYKRFATWLFEHRCKWGTTHTNSYGIPTRQVCEQCGVTREADTQKTLEPLSYCWVYSDGRISKPYALGEGFDD